MGGHAGPTKIQIKPSRFEWERFKDDVVCIIAEVKVRVGFDDNQLLQLCMAYRVWSDLVISLVLVHSVNVHWHYPDAEQ